MQSNECWLKDTCKKYKQNRCTDSEFCLKLFKLDFLYCQSLLSAKQCNKISLRIDGDGTDKNEFLKLKEIETNIEEFVRKGENLYIYSSICGNGKTAWSIRLLQSYLNAIWYKADLCCVALFINVPRFLMTLKESFTHENNYINHIKKNVLTADIVVWDEIGYKAATQFETDQLLNLINTRLDLNLSNIYTSNIDTEALFELLGQRLGSRIINLSTCIKFNGKDKRGINLE